MRKSYNLRVEKHDWNFVRIEGYGQAFVMPSNVVDGVLKNSDQFSFGITAHQIIETNAKELKYFVSQKFRKYFKIQISTTC